jgi:hypothetical protein
MSVTCYYPRGKRHVVVVVVVTTVSHDSSVGIALDYGLDDRGSGVRFPVGLGIFLFTTASRTALGPTQNPIQGVPGTLSLGVKRPGREADHSPPSSAKVKMHGATPPFPQYAFMVWCLVKQTDNFALLLLLLLLLLLTTFSAYLDINFRTI